MKKSIQICINCQKSIRGRSDKKYCSPHCKNHFHAKKRKANQHITQTIDRFLHRNRSILEDLFQGQIAPSFMVPKVQLQKLGFRFANITGIYTNSRGKVYHRVYDFAWMEFSSDDILIVKN